MQSFVELDDLQFLEKNAADMRDVGVHLPHLDQRVNLLNYIRIADDVLANMRKSDFAAAAGPAQVLDWGCGYGQMTWLLRRRGMAVTSFDIGPDDAVLPTIPLCQDLLVTRSTNSTALPFPDNAFDVVLSCGVLEHVDECSGVPGNEIMSLREIARVLRPNGQFLIYQLPQQWAWQEALVRRLKLGYAHPRRYTGIEITRILESTGFDVTAIRRANFVPKNLTGLPHVVRRAYSRFSPLLMRLDRLMCQIPLANRFAGVLEVVAIKATGAGGGQTSSGNCVSISPDTSTCGS